MHLLWYWGNKEWPEQGLNQQKIPPVKRDSQYMDGLVSTGKFISLHNIKNNFL